METEHIKKLAEFITGDSECPSGGIKNLAFNYTPSGKLTFLNFKETTDKLKESNCYSERALHFEGVKFGCLLQMYLDKVGHEKWVEDMHSIGSMPKEWIDQYLND